MRLLLTLVVLLAAAAPASAKLRALHVVGPVEAAAKSDGVSTVAWRRPGGPIVVWTSGRTQTVDPPPGACSLFGGPLAVGSEQLLYWCGPNRLWVTDAATGATTAVVPDRDLSGGRIPTTFAVGRTWARLDDVTVAVPGGHVTTTAAPRPACTRGWKLLPGTTTLDARLVRCGHPKQRRGLIGDSIQLGGGWLTWRPNRSRTSIAALRLRDGRVLRFRLPKATPGIDWYNAYVRIVHTRDRIFEVDNFTGTDVLRTAPLPR